ncbi:hypothetical protein chiPu_0027090, partial [Chiloscyllium punctatum]|nr:hypothetical protein [Chiloscyllium punctatum]
MDSGSLMMSEIIDIPDDSSFSEDSCLVMAMQGGSQAMGCGPGMPESWAQEAELSPARSRACAWTGRSFSCSSPGRYSSGPGPGTLSQSCEMLETAAAAIASGPRTYSTSSDTSALQAGPESPCPSQRYNQSPGPQAPSRTLAPHRLSRSNSDPAICGSTATSGKASAPTMCPDTGRRRQESWVVVVKEGERGVVVGGDGGLETEQGRLM